ncbi:MAG: aldehyde dehydrogenase family protein [Pseudomonadota bacterium]
MQHEKEFYINGIWVTPESNETIDVINPATEQPIAQIINGSAADVDNAVAAAKRAFPSFSAMTKAERLDLLDAIIAAYTKHQGEIAAAISSEMGAPMWLANAAQAPAGIGHFIQVKKVLEEYDFEFMNGNTLMRKEPIGVCAFITPWNWPVNQISCKVAPAIAAGCTMVLKPSEVSPLNAILFTEVMHEAGVPAGVFNLIQGDGPSVGAPLTSHKDIEMVSFTGSTRAGVAIAKAAADGIKRVAQELGGKSPNVILDDADLEKAVGAGVQQMMVNSGQSCNAPSRMLVPRSKYADAVAIAKAVCESVQVSPPDSESKAMGPVVSEVQFNKIQGLIQAGIDEGATVVAGGVGKPEGLDTGYYVKPTVFADVNNDMTIAREEIFGPVLAMIPYDSEEEAIEIANDTPYGLSGYVQSGSVKRASEVARQIRAGNVHINGANMELNAPFGGYKMSGNGREWGEYGLEEFLEVKAMLGAAA